MGNSSLKIFLDELRLKYAEKRSCNSVFTHRREYVSRRQMSTFKGYSQAIKLHRRNETMSESENSKIGQRMYATLQASGLLSSVEIELHENQRRELFIWCALFVETPCRIWVDCESPCGYAGFDVLSELIILGLKLSQSLVPSFYSYSPGDLLRVYRTKDEVLNFYADMASRVIKDDADLPAQECDMALRDLWLCCPKHRLLFVQRLLLVGWLHHLLENWDTPEREAKSYLLDPPSLQQLIAHLLEQTFTPQEYLRSRFAYEVRREQEQWDLRTHQCLRKHHTSLLCCPFHVSMTAIWYLFSAWLVHFDDIYHMSDMRDEEGYDRALSCADGVALFIHLSKLNVSDMTFPEWLRDVPTFDVSKYHCQQPLPEKKEESDHGR